MRITLFILLRVNLQRFNIKRQLKQLKIEYKKRADNELRSLPAPQSHVMCNGIKSITLALGFVESFFERGDEPRAYPIS